MDIFFDSRWLLFTLLPTVGQFDTVIKFLVSVYLNQKAHEKVNNVKQFSFSYKGRRDSSVQILDGTVTTMTVETSSTFFDSSTQTGKYWKHFCS